MLRRAVTAAAILLGALHLRLLAGQAVDGRLASDDALKWIVAAALVAGIAGLRRRGASIFSGRRATAIWVLAAVLHGPALADGRDRAAMPSLPEAIAVVAQIAASALGLGLALLAVVVARARRAPQRPDVRSAVARVVPSRHGGHGLVCCPRPPPVAFA